MSELYAWTDGAETIIAGDLDEAKRIQREVTGIDAETQADQVWKQEPDGAVLAIHWNEERGCAGESDDPLLKLTAAEWCEKAGKGWLCSTEF